MNHHCKLHLKRREDPKNEKSLLYQNGNNENDGILDVCLCEPSIPRMRKKIICQTQYILLGDKNHTSGGFYQICNGHDRIT
ncbi:uncharacterized protein LOC144647326 isoform X6 [Oculina patagonica]